MLLLKYKQIFVYLRNHYDLIRNKIIKSKKNKHLTLKKK